MHLGTMNVVMECTFSRNCPFRNRTVLVAVTNANLQIGEPFHDAVVFDGGQQDQLT